MARKPSKPRRPRKADIKAAADRAEKRAKGEAVETPKVEIDPTIVKTAPEDIPPTVIRVGAGSGGRPTAYKPEFCQQAAESALGGSTDEEIADELGVDVRTLYRWRARHPEFRQALQWGKENCDERVERGLYARAVGYTYDAVKIMQHDGAPIIVAHKEHMAPDVGAAKLWLTNRKAQDWRDVSRTEHTGKDGNPIAVTDETDKMALARWIAYHLTADSADDGEAVH